MKICGKCKQELSLDFFHNDKSKKIGKSSYCKECARIYSAKSYLHSERKARVRRIRFGTHGLDRKMCPKCETVKELDKFYRNADRVSGLSSWCKFCDDARHNDLTIKKRRSNRIKADRQLNPEKYKQYNLRRYGISLDNYRQMQIDQEGKCKICYEYCGDDLVVDHCHKTNKVRGLLCVTCNLGIGQFQDNYNMLISAAEYVKEYN